jgi:ubiquinone/menaquinone biosynthesis C-methylase UbiE
MKMTRFEKRFVNRQKKAQGNISRLANQMQKIDLPNTPNVLEIGCGIGTISAYLADNYSAIVFGTDYDPDQINTARNLYTENDQLKFQVEDASHLSFDKGQFDLVVSQYVFHHIPDWELAVNEISRVLKPNGYLCWADLAFPGLLVSLLKKIVKNYGLYTIVQIRTTFQNAGLSELNYKKKFHGPMILHQLVLKKT